MKPGKKLNRLIPALSVLLASLLAAMSCVGVKSEPAPAKPAFIEAAAVETPVAVIEPAAIKPPVAAIVPAIIKTSVAARVRAIRGFTYYNRETWDQFDLAAFEAALDGIRQVGGNSVWLVLPWHNFQPVALPEPQWNQATLDKLDQAVSAAEKRGMNVIAPLCYLGQGWEPKGIDSRIWTVDPAYYAAFSRYALELIGKLGAHHNMIYLLYTEGCEPKMETLRQFPQAVNSFREWARATNPDLNSWNVRWGTQYGMWNQVQPLDYNTDRTRWQRVQDHWRWVASIMRETHGALARQIRAQVAGNALLGYHDYSLISQDWSKGDSPIPPDRPYDFLSLSIYFDARYTVPAQFEDVLYRAFARCRMEYPGLPLALLETGASSAEVGPQVQAAAIQMETQFAKSQGLGINVWMWKDYVLANQKKATFGMIARDGAPKPACEALRTVWGK